MTRAVAVGTGDERARFENGPADGILRLNTPR